MKIKNRYVVLSMMLMCFGALAIGQFKSNEAPAMTAIVVDADGNPLSNVEIYSALGASAKTDDLGRFTINVPSDAGVQVEKVGYDNQYIEVSDLKAQVVMQKSLYLMADEDLVDLGFEKKKKREIVGAVSSVRPMDNSIYDNTQWVRDAIEGQMLGVSGSSSIRGMEDAIIVVDGIAGRNIDYLNMSEIDQISVLKDANAIALYGSQARNGVIVVTTKHGKAYKRHAEVTVNYTMKEPIALPEYMNSADYMGFYNEALFNDGLPIAYQQAEIDNYRSAVNPYRYPSLDLYSSDYLKPLTNAVDAIAEFSGGNKRTQYYVNLGWNNDGALEKVNDETKTGTNRFNIRANVDFEVNDRIKSYVGITTVLSSQRSALASVLDFGTTLRPNAYSPLLPISMVDATGNESLQNILAGANSYDGYLLGGNQAYQGNTLIADIKAGGYQKNIYRSTEFNAGVDFDMKRIAKGLTAKTFLSFDFNDSYRLYIQNKYSVYEPTWNDDNKIVDLTKFGDNDQKDQTEHVSSNDFSNRYGFYGLLNYKKDFDSDHHLNTTLLAYMNSTMIMNVIQAQKNAHLGLDVSYNYKGKYFANFSSAYVHSVKFDPSSRNAFSPTLGIAYLLSDEDFLKDNTVVNYLKLRASAGIVNSDMGVDQYFLYNEIYSHPSEYPNYGWADGRQNEATIISQGENLDFGFEKRIDYNLGFETLLLNSIILDLNYFNSTLDNQQTIRSTKYPSFYTDFRPYDNYNADRYSGVELSASYSKTFGKLKATLGGNFMYANSVKSKVDELYDYAYQKQEGMPVNAIVGLESDGFYSTSDFNTDGSLIDGLAVPSFGVVKPGDIKYINQNSQDDNVIDDKDMVEIGRWDNPVSYGVNLKLSYENFTLFALGVGQSGGNGIKNGDYYWVDGDDKYPTHLVDRWTEQTANSAEYPRLTSQSSNNNYRNSSFWVYDNSYFNIQRVQLTYQFSNTICEKLRMKHLSVNLSTSNLLQISKNKDVRQLNVGGEPQYRYYTVGLRTSF